MSTLNAYAKPEALVSTEWAAAHAHDPHVRLVEVDVDVVLDDVVIWTTKPGHVIGVDRTTGAELWNLRINAGTLKPAQDVVVMEGPGGKTLKGRINQVLKFQGLDRMMVESAGPGDIVLINGIEDIGIGVTLTSPSDPAPLPMLKVDEPTLTMNFCVNTSPLAGREGKFVTSRQIWDRLQKELQHNVALRVKETDEDGIFEVSGRGELHLTILLENMRREGYELSVGKPQVILKTIDGVQCEPVETLAVDCPEASQSDVMSLVLGRRGELRSMDAKAGTSGWIHMEFN